MRVLVTGASGYVGNAVAAELARHGHQVVGLIRNPKSSARLAAQEIQPVLGDLANPETITSAAASCDAVIHAASESSARGPELDGAAVDALIAELAGRDRAATLVYTSGVWLYGDTGTGVVDEASALNPVALVAWREAVERRVLEANGATLRTLVIRPGCVYGGRGGLTAGWFESAAEHGASTFVGDGNQRWTMVHHEDLAVLYRLALESPFGGEVFNATDRSRFTVRECAEAASRVAGGGGKVAAIPLKKAAESMGPFAECLALTQHVDSSKAARRLGWTPRHGGFVDGVNRYHASWSAWKSL